MNQLELQEVVTLYKAFLKDYLNEKFTPSQYPGFNGYKALIYLEADMEDILRKADSVPDKYSELKEYVNSKITYFPKNKIDAMFAKILASVKIRRDWAQALREVKKGSELSGCIGYSFYDSDISALAQLHKANKFRKKIESLLTDCNFHKECGDFSEGLYDEYLKENDTDDFSNS